MCLTERFSPSKTYIFSRLNDAMWNSTSMYGVMAGGAKRTTPSLSIGSLCRMAHVVASANHGPVILDAFAPCF